MKQVSYFELLEGFARQHGSGPVSQKKSPRKQSWKSDPDYANRRQAWLRQQHKQPLKERALEVLGQSGPELLQHLRVTFREHGRGDFDYFARKLLRVCNTIPATPNLKRRIACFESVEKKLRSGTLEETATTHIAPFEKLASRLGRQKAWELLDGLLTVCSERYGSRSDQVENNVHRMLSNAVEKRFPAAYLRACIRNETRAVRKNGKAMRAAT